jgi:4-amino-4-deoxy-L-arabinose transferase-like glycosyltransferase
VSGGKESRVLPDRRAGAALGLLVFVLALLLFGGGAARREIWSNDEHRYTEVARVMLENAPARLVPQLNGVEYANKPPGWFWGVAGLAGGLGVDLLHAALLPSVLASALTAALVALLGARLFGVRGGLAAGLVFATTAQVLALATEARLDALLTACITLSLFAWAWAELPEPAAGRRRLGLLAASGFCAGLGLLVKGPVALAIPGVVIAAYVLAVHGARGVRPRGALVWLGLGLLPAAVWLGAASAVAGLDYSLSIVLGHGVGHPLGLVNKQQPFWFYLKALPVDFLPWTVFLPAAVALFARTRGPGAQRSDRFVLCWILAPFVLLSCFPAKRHVYLLPLYPGLALAVGELLARALEDRTGADAPGTRLLRFGELALGALAVVMGGACLLAALGLLVGEDAALTALVPGWVELRTEIQPGTFAWGLACSIALLACGTFALRAGSGRRRLLAASLAPLVAALFLTRTVFPIESAGNSARPFFDAVRDRLVSHPVAAYGGSDFAANLFLERERVPVLQDKREADAFLAGIAGLVYLVAERSEIRRHGLPTGTRPVFTASRALASDLVLLAREAPGPPLAARPAPPS